jgi:hypothetical protein
VQIRGDGPNPLSFRDGQYRAGTLDLSKRLHAAVRDALKRWNIGRGKNKRQGLSTAHGKSSMIHQMNACAIIALLISCRTSCQGH